MLPDTYSSSRSSPSDGLCFSLDSVFFFRSSTILDAFGAPIRSRAIALTVSTARNLFAFFFRGMIPILPHMTHV